MTYTSRKELNHPNDRGKILLVNPFEAVAGATDNRGSNRMADSSDRLLALLGALTTLNTVPNTQVSVAYDHAAKTLVVTGGDLVVSYTWFDPTSAVVTQGTVTLKQGTHTLGATNTRWLVKITPGSNVNVVAGLNPIQSGANAAILLAAQDQAALQALLALKANPTSPSYTSCDEASLFIPFLSIGAQTISLFGSLARIRTGQTWKNLDRDTQYVQKADTTIGIAASGVLSISGGADSSFTLGTGASVEWGANAKVTLGAGSHFDLSSEFHLGIGSLSGGYDRGIHLDGSDFTVFETEGSLRLEGREGAGINLLVEPGGLFELDAETSNFLFRGETLLQLSEAGTLEISTAAEEALLLIKTEQDDSPLDIQTLGADSPIRIKAASGVVIGAVDFPVPIPGVALSVVGNSSIAPNTETQLVVINAHQTNNSSGRDARVALGGYRADGTFVTQASLCAEHQGAGADSISAFQLKVNQGSGLVDVFSVEADTRTALWRNAILHDVGSTPDTSALDPLYFGYTGSLPGTAKGSPSFTSRKRVHSATDFVFVSVDNTDDHADQHLADYRRTGLALRAEHNTKRYVQALFWAQNVGADDDRLTSAHLSVWDGVGDELLEAVKLTRATVETPATHALIVAGTAQGAGANPLHAAQGLKTPTIHNGVGDVNVTGPLILSERVTLQTVRRMILSGGGLSVEGNDVSLLRSNADPTLYYRIKAVNTPAALGIIQITTNATTVAPTVGVAGAGADYHRGITLVSSPTDTTVTVNFEFAAELASEGNSTPLQPHADVQLVYFTSATPYAAMITGQGSASGSPGGNFQIVIKLFSLVDGTALDLRDANNLHFRVQVKAWNSKWN